MSTATAPGYLSTAFYSQYNLIWLGGSALFSLASASPWPLLVGVVGELAWLGLGARSPAFRRRVDDQVDSVRRAQVDDEVLSGLRALSPEHAARVVGLGQSISWILLHAEARALAAHERAALTELELLRPAFLRLCTLREKLGQRLQELHASPPEQQVAQLSQAYAAEKDLGLRFTLHQSIKQAQRKIEQQSRFVELARHADLRLSHIEHAVAFLRNHEQNGTGELSRDVQAVMLHAAGIAALEAEVAQA